MVKLDELKRQLEKFLTLDEKLEKKFYEIEKLDIPQDEKDFQEIKLAVEQEVVKTKLDIVRVELKNALWAEMFPIKMPEVKKDK